jgi:hypothetical protein
MKPLQRSDHAARFPKKVRPRHLGADLVAMSVNCGEATGAKAATFGNASHGCERRFKTRRVGSWRIPAIIIGGTGPGTLSVVRRLSRAVPVIRNCSALRSVQKESAAVLAGAREYIPLRRRIGMKRAVRPSVRLAPFSYGMVGPTASLCVPTGCKLSIWPPFMRSEDQI